MRHTRSILVLLSLWLCNSLAAQFAAAEEVYKTDFLNANEAVVLDQQGSSAGDVLIFGDKKVRLYRNGSALGTVVEACITSNTIQANAVGDIDGDGFDDVVLANMDVSNTTGQLDIVVYRNLGSATFSAGTHIYTGGFHHPKILIRDVDGDGRKDLVVSWTANDGEKTINWFQQLPDSTFASKVVLLENLGSTEFAMGDLDGDGDEDIVTADGTVKSWYREGDGTYSPGGVRNVGAFTEIWLHDLDMDGLPDLFLCNPSSRVLRNDGAGGWEVPQGLGNSNKRGGLADVNGDGLLDVWGSYVNYTYHDLVLWYRLADGNGGMLPPVTRYIWTKTFTPAWTDLTGDGVYDLIFYRQTLPYEIGYFTGDGTGAYTGFTPITRLLSAIQLRVADIDGDGDKDIVTLGNTKLSWLEDLGAGKWLEHVIWTSPLYAPAPVWPPTPLESGFTILIGDADGNGTPDILLVTRGYESYPNYGGGRWYLNDGSGGFTLEPDLIDFANVYAASGRTVVKAQDMNGDGVIDIVGFHRAIHFWRGIAGGGFENSVNITISIAGEFYNGDVGDVDGDGDVDIVAYMEEGSGPPVLVFFENTGSAVFSAPQPIPGSQGFSGSIQLKDMDGDGDLDLFATTVPNVGAGVSAWFENDGGQFLLPQILGPYKDGLLVDLDLDGDLDLVTNVVYSDSTHFSLLLNSGTGQFLPPSMIHPEGVKSVVAEDMDGDGFPDLVISHDPHTISMYRNLGEWLTTSIGDDKALPKARVYPNPATSWVRVEIPNGQTTRWGLFDSMGRFISEGTDLTGGVHEFSRRGLASSLYFLRPLDGSVLDRAAYPVVFE